jgi:hypothetical protein
VAVSALHEVVDEAGVEGYALHGKALTQAVQEQVTHAAAGIRK